MLEKDRIYCGDSEELLKSLDDGSIDLIALAAMELNRHYIGFEANQDYIDIAETLISEKKHT